MRLRARALPWRKVCPGQPHFCGRKATWRWCSISICSKPSRTKPKPRWSTWAPPSPVQVNLGISGMERLVREVRAAVQRRQHEEVRARHAAIGRLQSEMNGTVTALLLSSELALETPGLPPAAAEKLESVHALVKRLRKQLETQDAAGGAEVAAGP